MIFRFRRAFLATFALFWLAIPNVAKADEGMWLPIYLNVIKGEMARLGAQITPEDIYNINQSSIKDAIVQMGGFCTGEIVSNKGLVFTNHHCGYDAVAGLSSTSDNLLDNGFWAKDYGEELPVDGLTMQILVRMQDVTEAVAKSADPEATMDSIIEAATADNHYTASVDEMYYGTEYYLMVYEVFNDIRLVGAPPADIGKFGGDTDNWMWPRHTGDFSIFRIYAGPDNKPASYSEDNKPYTPKHYLKISLNGYDPGDFSFIMGFPGTTERYLTAAGVTKTVEQEYPAYVDILGKQLELMKKAMDADDDVRLAMAGDYASYANSYKYFKGVVERSKKSDFIDQKRALEKKFVEWANQDPERTETYSEVVESLESLYTDNAEVMKMMNYLNMAAFAPGIVNYGAAYFKMGRAFGEEEPNMDAIKEDAQDLKEATESHFEDYDRKVDEEMLADMLRLMYNKMPDNMRPSVFESNEFTKFKDSRRKDRFDKYARYIMRKSFMTKEKKAMKFLDDPEKEDLLEDPAYEYVNSVIQLYIQNMFPVEMAASQESNLLGTYITGLREMQERRKFYPDANSTLRFTYGTVKAYPNDEGEMYNHYTVASQIMDKYVAGDEEFNVPEKLRTLIQNKDYGRYGEDGELKVNFITNTDITGGNSGSPVMDANGNLIGIAFDGNWESMLSDLHFEETVTRTINVDIRYVLFIIDKMANAQHVMNELEIVQ